MAIEAPPAPSAPAPTPAAASSPAKPQQREIKVSEMGAPATPAAPVKAGSIKEGIFRDLEKRVKPDSQSPAAPAAPAPKEPDEKGKATKPAEGVEIPEEEEPAAGDSKDGDKAVPPADPKKAKVSPWKLVEEYKAKLAAAEAKVLETEKRAIPEDKWKSTQETLTAKEKRLAELEEEIRYVNYSKSEEFKTKYQAPYEGAWKQAMGELSEIQIEMEGGNSRPMNANDLLQLVNLPLAEAKAMANEVFGDLSPEVMAHRKSIKDLFEKQNLALEEARKSGGDREKAMTEKQQREFGEMSTSIKDTWSKANEEVMADTKYGAFFKPADGDEQGNQRLAKGFELADRAFSENPMAPGLTPEQRQAIVRRHAAVRNRAAAFGKLVHMNTQKDARIAELQKLVDEYKGSEPGMQGSGGATPAGEKRTTMTGVLEDLRKRAKQN